MTMHPEPTDRAEVQKLANAVEEALAVHVKTSYRDDSPLPVVGAALPVTQPGRPAMSEKATDDSVRMIAFGGMTLLTGAGVGIVMVASDYADPAVIALICAAPAAVAVPILALARLLRGARPEPEVHQHFHGSVRQTTVHAKNTSVWARTDNRTR